MSFAERVLAVGVMIALFCGGYAWAQKAEAVIDGKVDANTAYLKTPVTYEELVNEREGWQQRADADLVISNDKLADRELCLQMVAKCDKRLSDAKAIGVDAKVEEVNPE